jgi:DNA-directed RNA polymerase subunit RPC12/RpoP
VPQAKCSNCEVRYFWPNSRYLVRLAHCPKCGQKLEPTSKNVNLRTVEIDMPADHPFTPPKKKRRRARG